MCCWALGKRAGSAVHRPVPRRADHARPDRRLRRACPRTEIDLPRRGHQPHGLVPSSWSNGRAATCTRSCKANCEKPEYYINEKVRGEVMRHFGYFMTESTGHLSEYLPWFRKNAQALATYCDQPAFGGEIGRLLQVLRRCSPSKYDRHGSALARDRRSSAARSVEYCSYILEAHADRQALPASTATSATTATSPTCRRAAASRCPVFVDRRGLHPLRVGDLPPQCAALNQTQRHRAGAGGRSRPHRRPGAAPCRPSRWTR